MIIDDISVHFSSESETVNNTKEKYRPAFMDHFDQRDKEEKEKSKGSPSQQSTPQKPSQPVSQPAVVAPLQSFNRPFMDGDFEFVRNFFHFMNNLIFYDAATFKYLFYS